MDSPPETNSALKKSMAVLDLFVRHHDPMSQVDVAGRMGISRQAAHRLLRQLEDNGLLLRLPEDRYVIGPKMRRMAVDALSAGNPIAPVRAILESVVAKVEETCNLGMIDGHELIYIDRVECNWPLRVPLRPGSRVPLHCTAMGKLLLAYLPTRRRHRLLDVLPLTRYTERTYTEKEAFAAHLADIRGLGYSINNQEDSVGLIALAVPIRNSANTVFAGLAVHGPEARFPISKALAFLDDLKAAAAKLSKALEF
ncbi:MAG: IclR family transcriptional regulator [Hyphomicrobiales bacterium]